MSYAKQIAPAHLIINRLFREKAARNKMQHAYIITVKKGDTLKTFPSIKKASEILNLSVTSLQLAVKDKTMEVHGWRVI